MGGEKNYTLEELFEIKTSPWLNIWSVVVQKDNLWNELYEFIWRTQENYWIQGYVDLQKNVSPNDWWVISISQVGSVHAQIRKNSWYGSQNIFILRPIESEKLLNHYVITSINKKLSKYNISYTTFPTLKTLKEETITLPTYSNWDIAYDYMENYIKEIEAYHIKEIEAYLQSTGLSSYELNKDEVESLKTVSMGGGRKFALDELFEKIERWQRLKKDDQMCGDIPFVTAWFNNTWITNYISNPIAKFPWNSITIDMFWNVFYRDYDFWADDNISVYYDVNNKKSKLVNLYLTSVLSKRIKGTFSYGKQFRCSKNMDLEITLPVNSDNQINYPLIESYIKATQKLVIKDLVDNINEKLKTYKEII